MYCFNSKFHISIGGRIRCIHKSIEAYVIVLHRKQFIIYLFEGPSYSSLNDSMAQQIRGLIFDEVAHKYNHSINFVYRFTCIQLKMSRHNDLSIHTKTDLKLSYKVSRSTFYCLIRGFHRAFTTVTALPTGTYSPGHLVPSNVGLAYTSYLLRPIVFQNMAKHTRLISSNSPRYFLIFFLFPFTKKMMSGQFADVKITSKVQLASAKSKHQDRQLCCVIRYFFIIDRFR